MDGESRRPGRGCDVTSSLAVVAALHAIPTGLARDDGDPQLLRVGHGGGSPTTVPS